MRKVYAFDFDGTLTTSDSLAGILLFHAGWLRFLWGLLVLSPWIVLSMLGLYDNGRAKERLFAHFFRGMRLDDFNDLCRRYAAASTHILRPEGLQAISQAQAEGGEVVIVSASVENWVQPFLPTVPVIGTQIEVADGVLTGRFRTPNCHGQEKVRRLKEAFPQRDSYHLTAYGDSGGDRELLALADESHYKPFRRQPAATHDCTTWHRLGIYGHEWLVALPVVVWVAVLNVLMHCKYYAVLFMGDGQLPKLISRNFHLSGFDAYTYMVLTDWGPHYDVVRHPLLPWLLYPLYLLNRGLWWLTGYNCAMPIVSALLCVCALLASVFFFRIGRRVMGLRYWDAALLTWLFGSFGYIMVTFMAPDHFALSMVMLLAVYAFYGSYGPYKAYASHFMLVLLTAGITLTNGAKVVVAQLLTMGHRFWHPRHLLVGVTLPLVLVVGAAWVQHQVYVVPKEQARQAWERSHRAEMLAEARANHARFKNAPWVIHKGKPIGQGEMLKWTDTTTDRWDTVLENLLGESIQLHEDHVLEDVLVYYRPVLLAYNSWVHYAVEALLLLLFLAGCWLGRRERLLWLLLCTAAIDLVMHLGLGFAINEVYIMSAHWLFTLPLIMGFLLQPRRPTWLAKSARVIVSLLTLYLIIYNGRQLVCWLLSPILPPPFNV